MYILRSDDFTYSAIRVTVAENSFRFSFARRNSVHFRSFVWWTLFTYHLAKGIIFTAFWLCRHYTESAILLAFH